MKRLLEILFGCKHSNTSFPITRRNKDGSRMEMYQTCLDCGKEFPYDWNEMRVKEGSMSDQDLARVLAFDALDCAETISGKSYKEDESTGALGFFLHIENARARNEMLAAADDTTFSNRLDNYQRIVESEGFVKVLELGIPPTDHCGTMHADDKFFVYYHPDGMLLVFDTYLGVNASKLYFNLQVEDMNARCLLQCSSGPIDENTFEGDFDGREALRFHIRQLRDAGKLLNPWKKEPFLWLLHWADTKTEGYDYKAINKERIAMLPADVQRMIRGGE